MSDQLPPSGDLPWLAPEPGGDRDQTAAGSARLDLRPPTVREATGLLVRAHRFGVVLRSVAIGLGALWLVTALSAFATEWHQIGLSTVEAASDPTPAGCGACSPRSRCRSQASWGYAVAAAIAYAASVWLVREEARDALDLLDDLDDDD